MTDFSGILASPTGLPAAQIFLNAGGTVGGTVMWFWVILVQFFTGCAAMLADTRMAYAFARDDALPFSRYDQLPYFTLLYFTYAADLPLIQKSSFSLINPTTQTPLHAVWLIVLLCSLLTLLALGSTQTATAIFNITAPALDLSYIAVIIAHRVYAHRVQFIPGPYTLGAWARPVNAVAITWVLFISVILFFPTVIPITAANMNYAIAVALLIAGFSLSWWWIGGARQYVFPLRKEVSEIINSHRFVVIWTDVFEF